MNVIYRQLSRFCCPNAKHKRRDLGAAASHPWVPLPLSSVDTGAVVPPSHDDAKVRLDLL